MESTQNGNSMVMPVAPFYGGGYGNGGDFGGSWGWIILLLLIAGNGWGGGFGGGFGDGAFPWLMSGQAGINANTNAGFDNAAIAGQLSGIQSSITNGFATSEVANCNRAMDSMQTAYTNEIADLNRSFDAQSATSTGFNNLQSQLANCCCENRLATANLAADIAREACADRAAVSDGIRDVIANQSAGVQRILDQMCNDKIDAKNEKIQELQNQITLQNLASSQAQQTAQLIADNTAQTQYIVNRVAPYPIPAYPVTGWGNYYGSGCAGFNPFGNVGYGNGSF